MTIDLSDLTAVARAADPAVSGCAVLRADRDPEPEWVVAERPDGVRVRLDGCAPGSPAVAAVAGADLGPGAVAARALAATRAAALPGLMTRADVTGVQVRAVVAAVVWCINNRLEALGQPRVLEAEILAHLLANPTLGDPAVRAG